MDRNDYYGGIDAGLSLDEAEKWSESKGKSFELSNPTANKIQHRQQLLSSITPN